MYIWEFVAYSKEAAEAFYAAAQARKFDVEPVFHATAQSDGRVNGLPGLTQGREFYTVVAYIAFDYVPEATANALGTLADQYGMDDWGSEPSTSFDPGDRDGCRSAIV